MPDPGQWLIQGSSDLWVNAGSQAERALNLGWARDQYINSTGGYATNASPSTAAAFLSTGDGTSGSGNSFYSVGRRLWINHGASSTDNTYCAVASASLAGGQTTVTIGTITAGATALSTSAIASVAAGIVQPHAIGTLAQSLLFTDNTYDIGASAATRPRTAYLGTALVIGTTPATARAIRLPNGVASAIAARNAGNTANVDLLHLDSGDFVNLSDGTEVGTRLGGANGLVLNVGAGTAVFGSAYTSLTIGPTLIIGTTPATAGIIRMPNNPTGGIGFRNAANSANIRAVMVDGSNNLAFGDTNVPSGGLLMWDTTLAAYSILRTTTADGTGHLAASQRVWGV